MSLVARQEYIRHKSVDYLKASLKVKSEILDEVTVTLSCHRKYANQLLRKPPEVRKFPISRPRARIYDESVRIPLLKLWEISDYLCSKRLVSALPSLIRSLENCNEISLSDSVRSRLISMSAATIDRLLVKDRLVLKLRGISTTKPGTILKKQIAIRTEFGWNERLPGYVEADLVAHCGESASGEYLYTLTITDIATGWTDIEPIMNKGREATLDAIKRISNRLPFPIIGIDTDNGSEFINYHLYNYCLENKIQLTRCRPYHKNDQCHVEQKNGHIVRRHTGYERLGGLVAAKRLAALYSWLRLHINYFQPTMKIESKVRVNGKVQKKYGKTETPLDRVLQFDNCMKVKKSELKEHYENVNPADLMRQIKRTKERLQAANRVISTHEATIPIG